MKQKLARLLLPTNKNRVYGSTPPHTIFLAKPLFKFKTNKKNENLWPLPYGLFYYFASSVLNKNHTTVVEKASKTSFNLANISSNLSYFLPPPSSYDADFF
jgi:hypothetical protein